MTKLGGKWVHRVHPHFLGRGAIHVHSNLILIHPLSSILHPQILEPYFVPEKHSRHGSVPEKKAVRLKNGPCYCPSQRLHEFLSGLRRSKTVNKTKGILVCKCGLGKCNPWTASYAIPQGSTEDAFGLCPKK